MLDDLSPREFESWCKVLLERIQGCQVENQPYVGDEGRDLIVHEPDGKIVVECKHYPNSTVGRPVVQKLHSAVLTAGTDKGMILTTGKFSRNAVGYVANLEDAEIELWDSSKLIYYAEKVGLPYNQEGIQDKSALAVETSSDSRFSKRFPERIFSEPRYIPGEGNDLETAVSRETTYEGYYLAEFESSGDLETAVGPKEAFWEGVVWSDINGRRLGFGSPPEREINFERLVPLGEALDSVPGSSTNPEVQPHEMENTMKDHILESLSKTVRYKGRNNVRYTRHITPDSKSTHLSNLKLVYMPRQTFSLEANGTIHDGEVKERGDDFLVNSDSMSICNICNRAVTESNQIFCAICHQTAHEKSFLTPDSFRCENCGATICYDHAAREAGEIVCTRCATDASKPPRKRWLPHSIIGVGASALTGAWALAEPGSQIAYVAAISAVGWLPFIRVALKGRGANKNRWLKY